MTDPIVLPSIDDVTKVQPSKWWIRDSNGYGSVTVTFVTVSFWVTTLAYTLSIFEKIGPFVIRPFDAAACGSFFGPILALYLGRKYTEAKFGSNDK